jgi:hypothetical protein
MSGGRVFVIGVLVFIFVVLVASESGRQPQSNREDTPVAIPPPPAAICTSC